MSSGTWHEESDSCKRFCNKRRVLKMLQMFELIAPTLTAFLFGLAIGLPWNHWTKVEK